MPDRTIVISDIHGCAHTLERLLDRVACSTSDHLIVLGDYIDRGPRSKQVLDLFLLLKAQGQRLTLLKGNHEVMFLEAWNNPLRLDRWLRSAGGAATLQSFGVETVQEIPMYYVLWFEALLDHYQDEQGIYVHAGFDFSLKDPFNDSEGIFWIRDMQVDPVKTSGRPVIHGHTPLALHCIEQMIRERSISHEVNIDNGCVYPSDGMNHLLAYFPETDHFVVQKNSD